MIRPKLAPLLRLRPGLEKGSPPPAGLLGGLLLSGLNKKALAVETVADDVCCMVKLGAVAVDDDEPPRGGEDAKRPKAGAGGLGSGTGAGASGAS